MTLHWTMPGMAGIVIALRQPWHDSATLENAVRMLRHGHTGSAGAGNKRFWRLPGTPTTSFLHCDGVARFNPRRPAKTPVPGLAPLPRRSRPSP